jgi:hypothetical protein
VVLQVHVHFNRDAVSVDRFGLLRPGMAQQQGIINNCGWQPIANECVKVYSTLFQD